MTARLLARFFGWRCRHRKHKTLRIYCVEKTGRARYTSNMKKWRKRPS